MKEKTFETVKEVAKKVSELKIQGAISISIAAEKALEDFIRHSKAKNKTEFIRDLKRAGKILKASRPTAVALPNAINQFISEVEKLDGDVDKIKKTALKIGKKQIKSARDAVLKIAEKGSKLIRNNQTILTHCHSSTVTSILKKAWKDGKRFEVISTETRPWRQGFITARELSKAGIPVTLIVDSAVMQNMPKIDKVFVGADTITSDGKLINKIGTSQVALIAKHFKVPVYVAAQTLKFTDKKAKEIKLEERPPSEILEGKKLPGVKVKNVVFDMTDLSYIKAIITENGIRYLNKNEVR